MRFGFGFVFYICFYSVKSLMVLLFREHELHSFLVRDLPCVRWFHSTQRRGVRPSSEA